MCDKMAISTYITSQPPLPYGLFLKSISLIFTSCLFVEKKLVTIKHFLLNFFFFFGGGVKMCDKMAISTYITSQPPLPYGLFLNPSVMAAMSPPPPPIYHNFVVIVRMIMKVGSIQVVIHYLGQIHNLGQNSTN